MAGWRCGVFVSEFKFAGKRLEFELQMERGRRGLGERDKNTLD